MFLKSISVFLLISTSLLFAQQTIQVFENPVGLYYGRANAIAPMKSGVLPVDYDRDGDVELVAAGIVWENSGQKDGSNPIYQRSGKGKILGHPVDLDGDRYQDVVMLKNGKFIWLEDQTDKGSERNFVERGNFQFVLGGDLPLTNNLAQPDINQTWSIANLADYDNDGRVDILLKKNSPEMLDEDTAYVPWKYADFGVGWIDQRWIFSDITTSFWVSRNVGTPTAPAFTLPRQLAAGDGDRSISYSRRDVSGCLFDWNADGKMDVFTQVEDESVVYLNIGSLKNGEPIFDNGRKVKYGDDTSMDHRKAAIPWRDKEGLLHVAYHGGSVVYESVQLHKDDVFSFSEAHWVLFKDPPTMALDIFAVPDVADLNGDGKYDLIVGSECGFVWYFENLDPTGGIKKWSSPELLKSDGKPIRMYKEYNLQGPIEYLIGYSNPTAEDWDLDGDVDLLVGNHGEIIYYFENIGSKTDPVFTSRGPIRYGREDEQTVPCAWRSRPGVGDMNQDGLPDLVTVSADRKMIIWLRYRDKEDKLRLSEGQFAVDSEGYPFNVCRTSRGIGRSKYCVVDWNKDGLMDIVTSASQSLSARTEFVYYYKNLGMKDEKIVMEFRPNQIKVTGHTQKGSYTHFRMVEPVDWDGDGTWEAIAGMDGRHPGIRNTWLYYWDELKEKAPEFEPIDMSGKEFTVELKKYKKEDDHNSYAVLEPAVGGGETAVLKKGEKVFLNRDYTFNKIPEPLAGMHFIRPDIESSFSLCREGGLVYALVPPADGPRRNCYIEYMKSLGFEFSDIKPFQLFGSDPLNQVAVMQKILKPGNKLVLGRWTVMVF